MRQRVSEMKTKAAFLAASYGALYVLGRGAGSTTKERRARLPGDDIVDRPSLTSNHAVTIGAPPEAVWPWLVQVGWRRGGWYTSRWVDQLVFPANRPSADRILREFQQIEVGDSIPDGPPESGCGFVVAELMPRAHLVLHSRTHLPRALLARGAAISWTWAFVIEGLSGGHTRLVVRSRARLRPRWLAALAQLLLVPADAVMARQMMRGIAERAELRYAMLEGQPKVPLRHREVVRIT